MDVDRVSKSDSFNSVEIKIAFHVFIQWLLNYQNQVLVQMFNVCTFVVHLDKYIFQILYRISVHKKVWVYHASTETRCEILSILSILAYNVVIKLSKTYDFQTALLILSVVSAVKIFIVCSLDTPEKPLSENEFKYFRKISWLILSMISLVIIISYFFG